MALYKLHYFPVSARGEFVQLVLEEASAKYELVNYNFGEHKKLAPHQLPFGQLPVLQEGEFYLPQTAAIITYLARKHNLEPKDPKHAAQVDAIVLGVFDTAPKFFGFALMKHGSREEVTASVHSALHHFETLLKSNNGGNGFFVGDKLTAADLAVFQLIDDLLTFDASLVPTKHNVLLAFHKRISEQPRIAAYLQSDRRHKFPKSA